MLILPRPHSIQTAALSLSATLFIAATAAVGAESHLARMGPEGTLTYTAWDAAGDRIPDFSNCGYGGGGVPLPAVSTKLELRAASSGDDTARIQAALDELAKRPLQADGFRGALLLHRGTYRINGTLVVAASGIVVRGEGPGADGTVLLGTGSVQRALIAFVGPSASKQLANSAQPIVDAYVPVGARTFQVRDASRLAVGDAVFVVRHGNAAWIHTIGMDHITPRPTDPSATRNWTPFDLPFDRVITAISGNRVTVDAPIVCAFDARWGGGELVKQSESERIEHVGLENLRGDSEFNPHITETLKSPVGRQLTYAADEKHALRLVRFDNVKNGWVRDVVAVHFYHGVCDLQEGAKWITVQDSASLDPVSVITGGRRYPFAVEGQLNLVQRCFSRDDRHAFVFGAHVPGPNVFLFCTSELNHATSEPHHRWSTGGLYDNVHAEIAFQDRQWMGSGHGWAGANYVAWNTEGTLICEEPPTAQNFAIGHVGRQLPGAFPRKQGYWESLGTHVMPRSLYLSQLAERSGVQAVRAIGYEDPSGGTRTAESPVSK